VFKKAALALVAIVLAVGVCGCSLTKQVVGTIVAVGVADGPVVGAVAGAGSGSKCSPKYAYTDLVNDGQAWEVIDRAEDQNTTQNSINITFSSSTAVTVGTTFSIELSANAGAAVGPVFVNVQAQINASVSKSVNTVVGNQAAVTVPAGATANGVYGVRVQVTSGHLYRSDSGNCGQARNYGNVQTYIPIAPGWCVWLSGNKPCRTVQGK
jgi:hypothetical protein